MKIGFDSEKYMQIQKINRFNRSTDAMIQAGKKLFS